MKSFHSAQPWSRRNLLRTTSGGFGYMALAGLLGQRANKAVAADANEGSFLKAPPLPAKVKRVIFLFMEGAMSQMDTMEYKPAIEKYHGKTGPGGGIITKSNFAFKRHGQAGTYFSELLPNIAKHADKMCWLRGLHTDTPAHPQAIVQLHTGSENATLNRPSMGAWMLYGLGTENQDLPGYITINPPANFGGAVNYGSAFLPAHYQGTRITDEGFLPNVSASLSSQQQRKQLDFIQKLNQSYANKSYAADPVEGIIASYELGFRMQDRVPDLLDISKEPEAVKEAYGVKDGPDGSFARQCLMARRLSEAGVRFVEICQGGWDHHNNLHRGLIQRTSQVDKATAALLSDLDARGLLDETLVIFGSEFGRLSTSQGVDGRDHNITGYPMFLVGAGVKKGFTYGETDELGIQAMKGRMHTNDLHATLLALMGLDHEKLTYRYAGRDFRLTDVGGNVIKDIFI